MKRLPVLCLLGLAALSFSISSPSHAQSDPFLGQIKTFAANYCPSGWANAQGQLLPIYQHHTLFTLIGNKFGGDGRITLGLPDLRGRFAVGSGTGPGLSFRPYGEPFGAPTLTLQSDQIPQHRHSFMATTTVPREQLPPQGRTLASFAGAPAYSVVTTPDTLLHIDTLSEAVGGPVPVVIQDPFIAMTTCINLDGIYPPHPSAGETP